MLGLAAIGLTVALFCLVSGRLSGSIITPPIVFSVFGLAIGASGLGLLVERGWEAWRRPPVPV